jgi:hypothetical protein
MGRRWESPGPASTDFTLSDYLGQLVIVCVGGFERGISTSFGDRDAVRASVVVLTGDHANEIYSDTLLFNSRIVSRFRAKPGTIALGAVVLGDGRGTQQPVDLIEVGPDAYAVADAWESQNVGVLDKLLADVVASSQAEAMRGMNPPQQQNQRQQQNVQQQRPANTGAWGNGQQQQRQPAPGWSQQAAKDMPALPGSEGWTSTNPTLDSMRTEGQQQPEGEVPF